MPTTKRKKNSLRWLLYLLLLLIGSGLILLYFVFGPNTGRHDQGDYLYIPTGASYTQVVDSLEQNGFVAHTGSFKLLAKAAGYKKIYPGRYYIPKGSSNYYMVRLLRSGRQTPLKLVLGKLRLLSDFAALAGNKLEADSATFDSLLHSAEFLKTYGLDTHSAIALLRPDTYEFYWTASADKVLKTIAANYQKFWTPQREQQAKQLGLSQTEVFTLASIIEEETNKASEKDTIASVYLNRLRTGMKLQADPTARFAAGDFGLRRITSAQTSLAHPYNTYYVAGLPPGPICTPSLSSLEAVLQPATTHYIYFCADPAGSGGHLFAATWSEHLKNARAYHKAQDEKGNR